MKTIISICLTLLMSAPLFAQDDEVIIISFVRHAADNTGDWLHKAGNEFATMIGDTLKVLNHHVTKADVEVVYHNNQPCWGSRKNKYEIHYYAILEPVKKGETKHTYFDRRGAMTILDFSSGSTEWTTMETARANVTHRCNQQMNDLFSKTNVALEIIPKYPPNGASGPGEFLAIAETFFAW